MSETWPYFLATLALVPAYLLGNWATGKFEKQRKRMIQDIKEHE